MAAVQKFATGDLVRKFVGAVAKEAPELARGASAARRAVVNVGLDINGGEKLAPEEVLAAIERFGAKPVSAKIAQSDTEPTLVIELDRALKPEEAHELSAVLRQEAIAQVDENGVGDLHGPAADNWKPFNPDYFIAPDGSRLGRGEDISALIDELIRRDNPADRGNTQWLLDKQQYSGPKGLRGADTAYTRKPVDIPTELLAMMKGARDEVRGPGDPQYDELMKIVEAEGWNPDPISVAINHRGEPYIYEGNTRAAIARALGIESVPGDIHWMNGGEKGGHDWTPEKIIKKLKPRYAGGDLVRKAVGALTKAADASGATVKRLYHGRAFHEPIKQLDPFISPNQLGIHLGDAETASRFAPIRENVRPNDAGGRVIPLDVELKNPLRLMDNTGQWNPDDVYGQLVDQGLIQRDTELERRLEWAKKGFSVDEEGTLIDDENAPLNAMLEIQDMIRDLGHDGVVYTNRYEFPDEAVQRRAELRSRNELNDMSDEEFRKEFPEARDSYIAFRREQLKSPFGDGPGVGFADGGPVKLEGGGLPVKGRAGLVYKLGSGLVDLLDFSGVANRPRTVKIPGSGEVVAAPIKELDDAAEGYMKKYGIPGTHRIDAYPEFDEDFARRIAGAFDEAKHMPNDPAVRRTYDALIDETMAQYRALEDTGLDVRFWRDADPYAKSPSMGYADIVDNGRLWVFPSDYGFGTGAAFDPSDNPLLKRVGRVGDKEDAVANDAFRVVHDAYGHFGPGNPFFRMAGEDRAWMHHGRMYSDDALPAMTAETRGQNSWVNYGPHEAFNKGKSGADTIYADQKATILPSWVWEKDLGRKPKFAGGDLVRKAGQSILDYLAPSAKHIRDDVIYGTELRGDGRKFAGFFGDVTSGKSEKYIPHGLDNYNPAIQLGDDAALFRLLRDSYSGNFDNHIKTSIPGFDETQNAVGAALLKTYGYGGADMLDIASSEGALIKALSQASDGRIRTTGIEPNPNMNRTFLSKPQAPGSRSDMSAFGSADDAGKVAWVEDDGTVIPFFDPKGQQYDVSHEAMAFQFISNARKAQAERVKQLLKPKGIAIFEEKFGGPKAIFDANEAKKDLYKAQYYTPEQMEIKRKEVLNSGSDAAEGMTDLQVSQDEMEAILRNTFRNRAQFWDSGNFKGYVASDDARALEDFLNNLQPLDSQYATTKTPRGFADGGGVPSAEDIASMTHDTSYGVGTRPSTLQAFGEEIDLGSGPVYYREDGSEYAPRDNVQDLYNNKTLPFYFIPPTMPYAVASDLAEARMNDDPVGGVMAASGAIPGRFVSAAGKMAYDAVKNPRTVASAIGLAGVTAGSNDAEAGTYSTLSKWGSSKEGLGLLDRAKKLFAQGEDMDFIRQQNEWFLDKDGVWRYELPSSGGAADLSLLKKGRLGEVYFDPHLFKQHPELEQFPVRRVRDMEGGAYDPNADEILIGDISKPFYATEMGGPKGLLAHEVYHKKANMDGGAPGFNTEMGRLYLIEDMKHFLNAKKSGVDSYSVAADQMGNYLQRLPPEQQTSLAGSRYNAELGEVLARREQQRMDMTRSQLKKSNPLTTLDTPDDAIFRRDVPATPWQWHALANHNNARARARADELLYGKPEPKGKK